MALQTHVTAAMPTCVCLPIHRTAHCAFTVAEGAVELRFQLGSSLQQNTGQMVVGQGRCDNT